MNKEQKTNGASISRRGFLAGVGVTAIGAGALGLSACASETHTIAETGEKAAEDNISPIAPVEAPSSWDKEADVVIIGTGGGVFGALRSVDLGYSTIVVEKSSTVGGASKNASVWGPIGGTACQNAAGFPDMSPAYLEALKAQIGGGSNWMEFAEAYDQAQRDVVDLSTRNGCEWQPSTVLGPEGGVFTIAPKGSEEGGMTALAIKYAIDAAAKAAESNGAEFLMNTEMTGLVKNGDAIVGIQVTTPEGNTAYYKANKGVIVATGGFTCNKDMLKEYVPTAYKYTFSCTAGPQDTGEGVRMLLGAGALFNGYDCHCIFDGGLKNAGESCYLYDAAVQVVRQPWLGINKFGDRYPYHTSGAEYQNQAAVLRSQPGGEGYVIFDSNYEEYAESWQEETQMCRRLIEPTMPDVGRLNGMADEDWRIGFQRAVDNGVICKADTLEELAEKLELQPQILKTAVEHWNELCEAGQDADGIYADNPEYLKPITTPPYYGAANGGILIATTAGAAVNKNCQVLSATTAEPIPGLYAAGCVIGRGEYGSWSSFAATTAYMAVSAL